jgi:ABC-type branched-subunit amino acid transport system ATPase component
LLYLALLFLGFLLLVPAGLVGVAAPLLARLWPRASEAERARPAVTEEAPVPAALAPRNHATGAVLIARELAKRFGSVRAVIGAEVVVEQRKVHALVGPNGAGKTTVLNLLSGLYLPDAGFVTVAGRAVTAFAAEAVARAGVGRSFQVPNVFENLTVAENLRLAVQARHVNGFAWLSRRNLAAVDAETTALLRYCGLAELAHAAAGSLARDNQRLLDIALALATAPQVLLLDEPLAGLADAERMRVSAMIKDIARVIPILLTEHDIDRAAEVADVVTVMHEGRVLLHGSADAARADATVRAAYVASGEAHVAIDAPPSAAGAATLLAVAQVTAGYGDVHIFKEVSLDVSENEIVALLGRNGAGKSTLLKALIGIVPPARGSIRLAGQEIARLPSAQIARRGIGYVPQHRGLFAGMTVADNLALGRMKRAGGASTLWDDERIIWVFPCLARRWYTPADALAAGEQQMVAVARALAGGARLLLLDEPFEGLPPAITEELFEAIDRLRYEVAMLVVDQHLDLALALADRVMILEHGAVTWTGPAQVLRDDVALRRQKLWI